MNIQREIKLNSAPDGRWSSKKNYQWYINLTFWYWFGWGYIHRDE